LIFLGELIIAYLNDRINFCFLNVPNDKSPSGLVLDLKIESEIGDRQRNVLKNVGKIERFVTDKLRSFLDRDFVFPCYQSIDLLSEDNQVEEGENFY